MNGIKKSRKFAGNRKTDSQLFQLLPCPRRARNQILSDRKAGSPGPAGRHSTSVAGRTQQRWHIAGNPSVTYRTLEVSVEWNSGITEDYIAMCKERFLHQRKYSTTLVLHSRANGVIPLSRK